jgi:hypothetical protein
MRCPPITNENESPAQAGEPNSGGDSRCDLSHPEISDHAVGLAGIAM